MRSRTIEQDIGPIHIATYNLNAFVALTIDQTTTEAFDNAHTLGSRGAFLLARTVTPYMLARPPQTMQSLFFTSAASALRGNATQSAHAAGLFGRRAIAQSLSHELWPLGIHVATVHVDGPVNSEDTSGRRSGDEWESVRAAAQASVAMLEPDAVADGFAYLHSQPRNCWTFELDMRPSNFTAWFHTDGASGAPAVTPEERAARVRR